MDVPEEVVDEGEGVGGVGSRRALLPAPRHDPLQARVDDPQERAEAPALVGGQLAAVAVPAVDPGVQGVGVTADDGDRTAVAGGQRGCHGDAEVGQAPGRGVLAGDRCRVRGLGVEVVLEEVAAPGRAEPVAAVQQALLDGFAGDGGPGGVLAEEGAQRGRVEHGGGTRKGGTRPMLGHVAGP